MVPRIGAVDLRHRWQAKQSGPGRCWTVSVSFCQIQRRERMPHLRELELALGNRLTTLPCCRSAVCFAPTFLGWLSPLIFHQFISQGVGIPGARKSTTLPCCRSAVCFAPTFLGWLSPLTFHQFISQGVGIPGAPHYSVSSLKAWVH